MLVVVASHHMVSFVMDMVPKSTEIRPDECIIVEGVSRDEDGSLVARGG